ncbi:MAG: HD domain-containing protein [Ruminococcaceae bacterium]|nr:HD domain-containing protein [Oscillospiraceae bacterium]
MMDQQEHFDRILSGLRQKIEHILSGSRLEHTLLVEQTAAEIARLYCPKNESKLRAAALLHDVTKELTLEEHISILQDYGVKPTKEMISAPATLHAITAALIIPKRYPEFDDNAIISAVRYHTTGKADMTLEQKIIYLADYIEPSRRYDSCKRLRELFFGADIEKMSEGERMLHLDRVILESLDLTLEHLQDKGGAICLETKMAREYLAKQLIH